MKKPKDVADLASRLASAASTPLVAPPPVETAPVAPKAPLRTAAPVKRKAPQRSTVPVFLRISQDLYDQYDDEAVRRTKATGRGVTVQQVIIDKLAGAGA
jgi:hypothetical protein